MYATYHDRNGTDVQIRNESVVWLSTNYPFTYLFGEVSRFLAL